jgi:multidrug efflux pump subunit AcrA (membrane-fusion protein)
VNRARRLRGAAVLAALAAGVILAAAGCTGSSTTAQQGPTAKVVRVGNSKVPSVVLTPLGAARIGVQTLQATTAPPDTVVPYSALLYEPNGAAAVYVNTGPLTYTRYFVSVDLISGNQVYLKPGGLPPGARVVTAGAEELLGVQNGVGEET